MPNHASKISLFQFEAHPPVGGESASKKRRVMRSAITRRWGIPDTTAAEQSSSRCMRTVFRSRYIMHLTGPPRRDKQAEKQRDPNSTLNTKYKTTE